MCGLTLNSTVEDLVQLYLAAVQALAVSTCLILPYRLGTSWVWCPCDVAHINTTMVIQNQTGQLRSV